MLDYKSVPLPQVKKFIKKTKNKQIKSIMINTIFHDIPHNPTKGSQKHGDLQDIWTWKIVISHQQFRIDYTIEKDNKIIPILVTSFNFALNVINHLKTNFK